MSFFDNDDFYSSKRPARLWKDQDVMKTKPFTSGRSSRDSRNLLVIASACSGAILMLLIVLIVVSLRANTTVASSANGVFNASAPAVNNGDLIVNAAQKINKSVVSVLSSKKTDLGTLKQLGRGSGIIIQQQGNRMLIVTNNHVIEEGTDFEVGLFDGEIKKAILVGADRISDLAVLEIEADKDAVVAEFGDSSTLQMGEAVIAIGSPLGLGTSTTSGIVSSPKQTIPVSISGDGEPDWEMDMIQTDAAINEGNSGGALVNMKGEVVGINTLKIANLTVEGMGFAIPSNDVVPILEELMKYHKVKRPLIGVTMQNLQAFQGTEVLKLPENVKTGIIVLEALGPAKDAGIQSQDVITEIDGKTVNGILQLRKYLYKEKKAGDTLSVTFYRKGEKETVNVVLVES
ncbi:serine protease [Paenibacillus albiflavus]|uniref:Serine protease n=1 Tax=Paenibacillus albiflavus TaxID=2545760 RepID=A0A4R4E9N6_9BACL|nr:S1C family serine protease [Paenibacillus albiflavus]TCZ75723.1 serine protease [Paenibacillus albiflavus]